MKKHTRAARFGALAAALPLVAVLGACAAGDQAGGAAVATADRSVTHDQNDRVPEGAAWTQHYFPSGTPTVDGSDVELHSDVLLPEDLAEGEKVPVILSVGAYFSHTGETEDEGLDHTGPSARFDDLVEGTALFDRGYALVTVDLRGFGGSSGCLDFMGEGEKADVEAAIEWASTQPWSTGDVGMYGKSYDALTGLVGNNLDQDALKAVVAQEPLWDQAANGRTNGVPRSAMVDSSRSYNEISALPAMADDDDRYRANSADAAFDPTCTALNSKGYQTADTQTPYWAERDVIGGAAGTDTPILFTQGLVEPVTEPHGMEEFLVAHEGPERGWIGQWDHKRGNDVDADGVLEMGRAGWFEETMAFYDEHLKGIAPSADLPDFAVQDSAGTWRAEDTWPTSDTSATLMTGGGSYVDDGAEGDPAVDTGNSFVHRSEPLTVATRITGTPRVTLDATGHGNVMVKLHDVAPDGTAVMFDEIVSTIATGQTSLELKSTDWSLAKGHSLAIEVGTIRDAAFANWIDTPSSERIEVQRVALDLALDDPSADAVIPGDPALFMEEHYLPASTSTMPAVEPTFVVPPGRG